MTPPMDRRRFLKVTAVTGTTAALSACGNPENQIVRFIPDEEIVPGIAEWRPSVCPLCAAGCGVQARVMDGDAEVIRNGTPGVMRMPLVKKLESDTAHFDDLANILFDQALLAEGGLPADPAAYVRRVNALLV